LCFGDGSLPRPNYRRSCSGYLLAINRAFPQLEFALVSDAQSLREASEGGVRIIAIAADDYRLIEHLRVGLVLNVASMQEMRHDTIAGYFDALRRSRLVPVTFYCCNREQKSLPGGEIVRFAEYPWWPSDVILIDELCPWHQDYYMLRPPFYRPYDGPVRHRLVLLTGDA
jgi:hypothetical protein